MKPEKQAALHAAITRHLAERQSDPADDLFRQPAEISYADGVAVLTWAAGFRSIDYSEDGSGGFTLKDHGAPETIDGKQARLVKAITADVLHRIDDQFTAVAVHEAGHAVTARACGFDVVDAVASLDMGYVVSKPSDTLNAWLTNANVPADLKIQPLVELSAAQLATYIAGCVAVNMHECRRTQYNEPWHNTPSSSDINLALGAIDRLRTLTGKDSADLVAAATARAIDILKRNWPAVLGVADRLKMNKPVESINSYLRVSVPIKSN